MDAATRPLTFCWWNVHDHAHYDPDRSSHPRWPDRRADYDAKRGRLLDAFGQVFGASFPDLLAVCEVTRQAARELAAHLPPGFDVAVPPPYPHDDGFQVAVLYRTGVGFSPEAPLIPGDTEDVSRETRPMIPIHLTLAGHVIRFVACHWTAFDAPRSREARQRQADVLRRDTHAFLAPEVPTPGVARHVIVLGDLNEEPMAEVFESRLVGLRDRESSRARHWRDEEVRRVRLYNAAWRYLGEQVPHDGTPGGPAGGAAGTFYSKALGWRTFDHVLVSSGLLGTTPPYLDEADTRVASTAVMWDDLGRPKPFTPGDPQGVSDHLPVVGRLILSGAHR